MTGMFQDFDFESAALLNIICDSKCTEYSRPNAENYKYCYSQGSS